jgi:hypothetical protein
MVFNLKKASMLSKFAAEFVACESGRLHEPDRAKLKRDQPHDRPHAGLGHFADCRHRLMM